MNRNFGRGIRGAALSNNNTFSANETNENARFGLIVISSNGNVVSGNTANGNGLHGIFLTRADNNTVVENKADRNVGSGFRIKDADNNDIEGNSADGNGIGFDVDETSFDNDLIENEACDNTIADAQDTSTGAGNLWVDNEFCTVGVGIPAGNLSDETSLKGKIVFDSPRNGPTAIFSMDADGSNVLRLTDNSTSGDRDFSPHWSPDGEEIVFYRDAGGDRDIYLMDSNGGNVRQITDTPDQDFRPVWSPDGEQIAFGRSRGAARILDVHIMNVDGSDVTRIATGGMANWSPDGERITFVNGEVPDVGPLVAADVFVIDIDGGNQEQLTFDFGFAQFPAWSPNGEQIVFGSNDGGDFEIYVMDADGSDITQLTDSPGANSTAPHWAPNGKRIVFMSNIDGDSEIYVMDADESNLIQITSNTSTDSRPHWFGDDDDDSDD